MVGEFTPVILAAQRRGQESYKLKFSLGNLARLKKEGRKEGRKKRKEGGKKGRKEGKRKEKHYNLD
jgi:hypothetical protein